MVLEGLARKVVMFSVSHVDFPSIDSFGYCIILHHWLGSFRCWIWPPISRVCKNYSFKNSNYSRYQKEDSNVNNPVKQDHFPYWCFAVAGPFLYIAYFFHLYFNVAFTHYMVGVILYWSIVQC